MEKVSANLGGREITLETGQMARQASGSVVVRYGDTMVLVTATADRKEKPGLNFLPLAVHYVEKMYSAGKIPGGFFKREGRLSDPETLISRFIDRPVRPLFPSSWRYETQIVATVLSTDHVNEPAIAAMLGASAALAVSDVPFDGPIAGVRVARVDGELLINPFPEQQAEADLNFIIAGSKDAILMVEGMSNEVSEADALEAILFGHDALKPLLEMQTKLQKKSGKTKRAVVERKVDAKIVKAVEKSASKKLEKALKLEDKMERYAALDDVKAEVVEELFNPEKDDSSVLADVKDSFDALKKDIMHADSQRRQAR